MTQINRHSVQSYIFISIIGVGNKLQEYCIKVKFSPRIDFVNTPYQWQVVLQRIIANYRQMFVLQRITLKIFSLKRNFKSCSWWKRNKNLNKEFRANINRVTWLSSNAIRSYNAYIFSKTNDRCTVLYNIQQD